MAEKTPSDRPDVTSHDVRKVALDTYGWRVISVKECPSFEDRIFYLNLDSPTDQHGESEVILKFTTPGEDDDHSSAEVAFMRHLAEENFNVPHILAGKNGDNFHHIILEQNSTVLICYAITFFPGPNLAEKTPLDNMSLFAIGRFLGQLRHSIKGFHHPAVAEIDKDNDWALDNLPKLCQYIPVIENEERKIILQSVISAFEKDVSCQLKTLEKGVIHGDLHDDNLILLQREVTPPKEKTDSTKITGSGENKPIISNGKQQLGIIDFGDMIYSCCVFELAISVAYFMMGCKRHDILDVAGHIISGYSSEYPLPSEEYDMLFLCICGRYCQELLLCEYEHKSQPDNDYLKVACADGWPQLMQLWKIPRTDIYDKWNSITQWHRGCNS